MEILQDKLHKTDKLFVTFSNAVDESIVSYIYLWGEESFDVIE